MIKALTISRAVARFFNGGVGVGVAKFRKVDLLSGDQGPTRPRVGSRVNAPVRAQGAKPLEAGINTCPGQAAL